MSILEVGDSAQNSSVIRYHKQRGHQRFDLQFPVRLSFSAKGAVRDVDAVTENVSSYSLLLKTSNLIPLHKRVSFTMTVRGSGAWRAILLVGTGDVVRRQRLNEGAFAIAIACEHPITELETDLAAAS